MPSPEYEAALKLCGPWVIFDNEEQLFWEGQLKKGAPKEVIEAFEFIKNENLIYEALGIDV